MWNLLLVPFDDPLRVLQTPSGCYLKCFLYFNNRNSYFFLNNYGFYFFCLSNYKTLNNIFKNFLCSNYIKYFVLKTIMRVGDMTECDSPEIFWRVSTNIIQANWFKMSPTRNTELIKFSDCDSLTIIYVHLYLCVFNNAYG